MRAGTIRSVGVVVVALAAGCGGDDDSGGGGAGGFDVDRLVRACTIVDSCYRGYGIDDCIVDFQLRGTPAQVDCVLGASVADCDAAQACIGTRRVPDTNCVDRCLDDGRYAQCNGTSMHTEITCATSIQSGAGPMCITSGTSARCGVAACSAQTEFTCDGAVSHVCSGGIESTMDCARFGHECVTDAEPYACLPPSSGPCTTMFGCQGDQLLSCDDMGAQRVTDCKNALPEGTCVVFNNFSACGWATECDPLSTADRCIGSTLRACLFGAIKDIDCTSVGGTQCLPSTGAPGAFCSP